MRSRRDEAGQAAPLLALVAVTAGLACLALGRFGGEAVVRAQARTAADASALAGAAAGPAEAARLAAANGAELSAFETAGSDVRARASVGGSGPASARARRVGPRATVGGVAAPAPPLRAALARAAQMLGRPVPVLPWPRPDGSRHLSGPSMHERGLAVDIAAHAAEEVAALGPGTGLCRPYPIGDPAHFELAGVEGGPGWPVPGTGPGPAPPG